MNKLQKEEEWKKFFDKFNIEYEYKKQREDFRIKNNTFIANPSFYLPKEEIYLHVGTSHYENITKDYFIYDNAVKDNIYPNVFITDKLPQDLFIDMDRLIYSIKEEEYYKLTYTEYGIEFIKTKEETHTLEEQEQNALKLLDVLYDKDSETWVGDIPTSVNIENIISKSDIVLENVLFNDKRLSILESFHPKQVFHIKKDDDCLVGIRGNNFIVSEGCIEEGFDESILEDRYILIQGNHKGLFSCSVVKYKRVNNKPLQD